MSGTTPFAMMFCGLRYNTVIAPHAIPVMVDLSTSPSMIEVSIFQIKQGRKVAHHGAAVERFKIAAAVGRTQLVGSWLV